MAELNPKGTPVVVIGLGRFGSAVALELTRRGTEVLAIDNRHDVVQRLSEQLTQAVTLDSTDLEALRQVGVPEFHHAVVAIGSNVEASILTTSLLVDLGIDTIWAKALTHEHARILERVGAHHVVLPEHEMGERVGHLVSARLLDYVEIGNNFAMVQATPPQELVGVPLNESRRYAKLGVSIVAVKAEDAADFERSSPDTVLRYGDTIVVVGETRAIESFAKSL